jgi:hypothetical protein
VSGHTPGDQLDLDAIEARCSTCKDSGHLDWLNDLRCPEGCAVPPNEVRVDATGCSCKMPPYTGFQRTPIDPACPLHGEPLTNGDGDVLVIHPDGSTHTIHEPPAK